MTHEVHTQLSPDRALHSPPRRAGSQTPGGLGLQQLPSTDSVCVSWASFSNVVKTVNIQTASVDFLTTDKLFTCD